ncbi:hypothetical protein R3P38DRAFT_3478367 [Favolaschia claudopus]|uniref:Uncharacterized protein n=1 Tax=Favolaschia claudopus TaxID=2862362 RepID=A0AAV9ZAH6_9AGAR
MSLPSTICKKLPPSSTARHACRSTLLFRFFLNLSLAFILGCISAHFLSTGNAIDLTYYLTYFSALYNIIIAVLGHFLIPADINMRRKDQRMEAVDMAEFRSEAFSSLYLIGTVIGRIWSNHATRDTFILVWKGIFETIETITGKKLNFKAFSPTSNLLGAIGDSEGAQAQGLADVVILRQMNCDNPVMHFDDILKLIWKTCLVHFTRGVLGLRDHITDEVFQYLLSFPYLNTSEDIQEYYTFCADSRNAKVQGRLSLAPCLPQSLSFWDLTPNDTNPIEGSHAEDNQIKPTNRPLLEAILLAKEQDAQTARIVDEMISSGVLQNLNNSLQARFKMKAQRQARALKKKRAAESELITHFRKQIAMLTQASGSRLPSTPKQSLPVASSSKIRLSPSNAIIDVDEMLGSPPTSFRDLSDDELDYAAALNSDVMSPIFKKMARDYSMPGVDDESN